MTLALLVRPEEVKKLRPHTIAILFAALAARAFALWFVLLRFPHRWLYSRGIELGTLAQSLVAGHGLSSPFGGATGPTALLAPGYPAIIASFFVIFGSFTFRAAIAVMTIQLLFSVLTVLVLMQVAQRCFGARVANLAGAFWALSLPLLWMPTIFWETCLSTLLLVGMLDLALRCERKPSSLLWIGMGVYSALTVLVNPALLLALLAMMGWAAWQTRKVRRYAPIAGLLALLLVFAPWPVRNARVLHAFIPLRSTVGFELWVGNRAGASGFLEEAEFPIFNAREYASYVKKGEVEYMRDKSTLAMQFIRSHPFVFLRLSSLRFVRFWTGTGSQGGSVTFAIHAVLTTVLGVIGLGRLVREHRVSLALLFAMPLILFPLPYYLTHAEFRYRLVIDPLLTILAAYGVTGTRGHGVKV
jgi:4-amino-4-deoxy-L-arabinose transferase-like glycosyltransferase